MVEHYMHEIIEVAEGIFVVLDVADTWDCGWEGAYAIINIDTFTTLWRDECGCMPTKEDIKEWAEDYDCILGWEVVSSHHKTGASAEKALRRAVKRQFKKG